MTFYKPPQPPQGPQQEYQWPKFIPKSPSSFSTHSFRNNRQHLQPQQESRLQIPSINISKNNYSNIDEFDLDKIEYEIRRKSLTNLFDGSMKDEDERNTELYGTAV